VKDYSYPELADVAVTAVMQALSDEGRLSIVRKIMRTPGGECACGEFCDGLSKATVSHHMRVLRRAGLLLHRTEGTRSLTSLRTAEVEKRFPGLLRLIAEEPAGIQTPEVKVKPEPEWGAAGAVPSRPAAPMRAERF
jgi:DNA-binding transcriptional ArsR family regulator